MRALSAPARSRINPWNATQVTPAACTSATIWSASATVIAIGLPRMMCLPARAARIASSRNLRDRRRDVHDVHVVAPEHVVVIGRSRRRQRRRQTPPAVTGCARRPQPASPSDIREARARARRPSTNVQGRARPLSTVDACGRRPSPRWRAHASTACLAPTLVRPRPSRRPSAPRAARSAGPARVRRAGPAASAVPRPGPPDPPDERPRASAPSGCGLRRASR